MKIKNKITVHFLIFIIQILFLGCSQSTFSGSASNKKSTASTNNDEIVISTNEESPEIEDISDPELETEATLCFEDPAALPDSTIDLNVQFNWKPSGDKSAYQHVWNLPAVGPIVSEVPSIVACAFNDPQDCYTFAIDGKTGETQWVSDIASRWSSPVVGDIDEDGKNEVIVWGNDEYIYALFGINGKEKWRSSVVVPAVLNGYNTILNLADIDEDGKAEVLANEYIFDGQTGTLKTKIEDIKNTKPIAGDVNLSSVGLELITFTGVYSGKSGELLCTFSEKINHLAFATLRQNDPVPTIIGTTSYPLTSVGAQNKIIAYRGDNCTQIFAIDFPGGGGGAVNIADFDGDGELEFGTGGTAFYAAFDTDGKEMWRSPTEDDSSGVTGSTAFDFNGDGAVEIVYSDERNLHIYDGKTGRIVYQTPTSAMTGTEYPIVVDVDGDDHAEIVVAANVYHNNFAGIRVFKSPKNDWIGTRKIWNQSTYNVINVSDTGQIVGFNPETIWKRQIASEYLLGFRNNLPLRPQKKCE